MKKKIATTILFGLCSMSLLSCGSTKAVAQPTPKPRPIIVTAATPTPIATEAPLPTLPEETDAEKQTPVPTITGETDEPDQSLDLDVTPTKEATPAITQTSKPTGTIAPTKSPTKAPTKAPAPTTPAKVPTPTAGITVPAPTTTSKNDTYQRGILTEDGFESAWLNLRFTTPPNVLMLQQKDLDGLTAPSLETAGLKNPEAIYEMRAQYFSGTNIVVKVLKLSKADEHLTEEIFFAQLQEEMRNNSGGLNYFYEETPYLAELAGEDYIGFTMAADYGDEMEYQEQLARRKENYLILVTASYQQENEEEKDTLLSGFASYDAKPVVFPEDVYQKGIVTTKGYESEWLGIQFAVPDDMEMVKQEQLSESYEMKAKGKKDGFVVQVMAEKKAYSDMTAEEYILTLQYALEEQENGMRYTFGSTCIDEIAGKEFLRFDAILEDGVGNRTREKYYVQSKDHHIVWIKLTGAEEKAPKLEQLAESFTEYH